MKRFPLIEKAFEFPGVVFAKGNAGTFRDDSFMWLEVAIQQDRVFQKFARFVVYESELVAVYFRHDRATIASIYSSYPTAILPCERYPTAWSRAIISRFQAPAFDYLRAAYDVSLSKLTKKGRGSIESIAGEPNHFLTFHNNALRVASNADEIYLSYSECDPPAISIGGRPPVAEFAFNRLKTRRGVDEPWEVHHPDVVAGWELAIDAALLGARRAR